MATKTVHKEASTSSSDEADSKWWGEFEIPEKSWCRWQLGQIQLLVWRSAFEWRFAWTRDADPLQSHVDVQMGGCEVPESDTLEQARYVIGSISSKLRIDLQLADRAMVARPEIPVYVPAGDSANLLVSTGIWLQFSVNGSKLLDLPVNRASDTWFGPNTREGEMCYFCLTRARTVKSDLQTYPHRATTPVKVVNNSSEMLRIERLRVPTPILALYKDENGEFETESLVYRLVARSSDAVLEIDSSSTDGHYVLLSTPRQARDDRNLTEALSRLFG